MYSLQTLPNWNRKGWDITLGVWNFMNNFYPVVVTHPVNKVLKDKVTKLQDKQVLAKCVLQCSTQTHVCHRKHLVLSHTWLLGIVLRTFIPFDMLVGLSPTPRLHAARAG